MRREPRTRRLSVMLSSEQHWLMDHIWKVAWAILALALPLYLLKGTRVDVGAAAAYAALAATTWAVGRYHRQSGAALLLVGLFAFWTWYVFLPGGIPYRFGPTVATHMVLLVPTAISMVALWGARGLVGAVAAGLLSILWAWESLADQTYAAFILGVGVVIGFMFRRLVTHLERAQDRVRRAVDRLRLLQAVTVAANEARQLDDALRQAVEALCRHEGFALGHAWKLAPGTTDQYRSSGVWHAARPEQAASLRELTEARPWSADQGLLGIAVSRRSLVDVALTDPAVQGERSAAARAAGLRRCLVLPVAVDDTIVAVVEVFSAEARGVEPEMLDIGRQIVNQLAVVVQRQRAEAEAVRRLRDYQRLFEHAHDAIVIFDPTDERVLEVNPRACELYGTSREELIGTSWAGLAVDVEKGRAKIRETLRKGAMVQYETVQRTPAGKELHLEVNASRVDYRGRTAILSLNRDVSGRKQLERQFLQAQRMDAMGRLAGGVAHDFNNMMTAVLGYAELLEMEARDDQVRSDLREIEHAAEKAAALARQLLAFSSEQPSQPTALCLNELVTDMQKLLRRVVHADIDLELELGRELYDIEADPTHLEQVLMNLVVNARDAMPKGGRLVIRTENVPGPLRRTEPGRHTPATSFTPGVLLTVTDTGCGMDEATQSRVFEPFFSTKPAGAGTGLGLATVYGIVTQHHGEIVVESEVGEGTAFLIYFPRRAGSAARRGVSVPPKRLASGAETVLVVEDEVAVRELARRALEEAGYRVLTAENGADAIGKLAASESTVDLVVTDVVMPKMGGAKLAQHVALSEAPPPVLFMSGHTGDERLHELLRDGEAHFLEKPFTPQSLTKRVREVLDGATT